MKTRIIFEEHALDPTAPRASSTVVAVSYGEEIIVTPRARACSWSSFERSNPPVITTALSPASMASS